MRIFSCALSGGAALMVDLGFAVISGSWLLAAVPATLILLISAYVSWERRTLSQPARRRDRRQTNSAKMGYVATYDGGAASEGSSYGGDCGFGPDGGSFGGNGGC